MHSLRTGSSESMVVSRNVWCWDVKMNTVYGVRNIVIGSIGGGVHRICVCTEEGALYRALLIKLGFKS